jgi:hypothetical protein
VQRNNLGNQFSIHLLRNVRIGVTELKRDSALAGSLHYGPDIDVSPHPIDHVLLRHTGTFLQVEVELLNDWSQRCVA